jgi:phosphoenolpyruvate carboxykinase (GTP)
MGDRLSDKAPRIFYVNWFRKSPDGKWLWPGFGENARVLKWMCERVEGEVEALETPIGLMPLEGDLDCTGLDIPAEYLAELLRVDADAIRKEMPDLKEYLEQFGDRVPARMWAQYEKLLARLNVQARP